MSERCGCSTHATSASPVQASTIVAPTTTVQTVIDRSPRALEALKALGLNHCCGAHLTLTEAAASAGVPLITVLTRLNEALAPEVTA